MWLPWRVLVHYLKRKRQESFSFLCLWVTLMLVYPELILFDAMALFSDNLKLHTTTAAALVNVRDALTSVFGIVGAIIVDIYLTHYGMVFFSSLFYLSGLILLAINPFDPAFVGIALSLIGVGKCSLINSSNDLGRVRKRSMSLVNLIQFVAEIVVVVLMVVQMSPAYFADQIVDNSIGRPVFLISAILMSLVPAVTLFYLKKHSFVQPIDKRGTPLGHIPRVFMAAILKMGLSSEPPNRLYENALLEKRLEHTSSLRFLDKAAVIEEPENERSKRLCTITQVEECKRLLRMVPICTPFLAYGMVKSIGNTFFLEQTNGMNVSIGGKEFPREVFLYAADWTSSVTKRLYMEIISDRLARGGTKYAPTIEYAMGMVLSTLCCTVASWVAMEIYKDKTRELSVLWLIPQFVLFGAMNGLASDGIEKFYSGQLPPSMKRYASVFSEAMIGVGSIFAILLVFVVQVATKWFPDKENLENDQLDRFYHLLTVVGIVIFFVYSFFAVRYRYQDDDKKNTQGQVEIEHQETNAPSPEHAILVFSKYSQEEEGPAADNSTKESDEMQNDDPRKQIQPADGSTKESDDEQNHESRKPIQPADSTGHVDLAKEQPNLVQRFLLPISQASTAKNLARIPTH